LLFLAEIQRTAEEMARLTKYSPGIGGISSLDVAGEEPPLPPKEVSAETMRSTAGVFRALMEHAKKLEMTATRNRLLRLGRFFDRKLEWAEFAQDMKTLQETIEDDLENKFVMMVPAAKESVVLKEPNPWEPVKGAFQDAGLDISDIEWCYITDNNTACVFHCMRILEKGLEKLANLLDVPYGHDQWHIVIQNIESAIRKLQDLPKGQTKTDKLTYYSNAAMQFMFFKDAWRNHVSHARAYYDENQALSIMTHVREFMLQMATDLS
jgi:hypothetical protein